jgi:serine protease Do
MKSFLIPVLMAAALAGTAAAQDADGGPAAPPPPPPQMGADTQPPAPPVPPMAPAPMMTAQMVAPPAPPAPAPPPVPPMLPMGMDDFGQGGFLGVGVQEIDADHAQRLKMAEPYGVELTTLSDDGPAAKAGLKAGDVVLEFNGQRVEGVHQFVRLVRETPPGRKIKLLVNHDGNSQTVTVTVAERKPFHMDPKFAEEMKRLADEMKRDFGSDSKFRQEMQQQFGQNSQFQRDMQKLRDDMQNMHWEWGDTRWPDEGPGRTLRLGVESEPVGPQLAEFFGVKQGVLVRSVTEGSAAAKAGIKAGDVVVKIGNGEIASPGQIARALREADTSKPVPVIVVRDKRELTLNATFAAKPDKGR